MAIARIDAREWEVLFGQLRKSLNKPSELLRAAFFTRGIRAIVEHFRDEKGPNGSWQPRSEYTQRMYGDIQSGSRKPPEGFSRGSFRPSNKLLVLTGLLRKSLSVGSLKKQTEVVDREKVMVFSPVWYSGHHDEGDPSRRLPARPFMWLSDAEKNDISNIVLSMATGQA